MGIKFTNNATTTLASGVTAAATTVVVTTSTGALFPSLGAGDYFYATLTQGTAKSEIIKVTARSGDTLTVVRGQDNTSAQSFNAGDAISLRPVAAIFTDATLLSSTQVTTALGYTPLSGNQTITFTGDATGSGATSVSLTLSNSGATAGTYGSSTAVPVVTVDAKGRITSVTTQAISGSLTFTGDVSGTGSTGGTTTLTLATVNANIGTFNNVTVNAKGLVTAASNVAYLTGNQTITFTGDATGSGATSVALTLANSGVTAGTYTKVTVDAKGRVTTGASLASADLPTYTGMLTSSQVTTALGYTPYNAGANTVLTSANYNSYSPTLTGGGASGSWGISVTGSSASCTGNSATVTNGVYTTGTQTIDGVKTFRGAASTDAYMYLSAVNGIAVFQIAGSGTNSAFLLFANSTNNERSRITVTDSRIMYFSNNSGTTNHLSLDASGNLTAAGNITANSDERLKTDWSPVPSDFITRLADVKRGTYTRIDSGERQAGASAQGMREVLPEVVMAAEDGTLSLAYGNAALVAAIELAGELVHTRNKVAQLEAKLAKITGEG